MNKLKDLILIIFIVFIMISLVPKKMQNDTFFTIAGGRLILQNGVDPKEQLVWHNNLKFTNSRWGFDVLITLIYNHFNLLGIYIFVIISVVIQGILYYCFLVKITQKKVFSFIFTVISMWELRIAFCARAQIISNLILLIEFYCLEQIKSRNQYIKRYIITLIILSLIFVNVHSSTFPIYLVVFLPYFAEFILSKMKFINKKDSSFIFEVKNFKILTIVFVIVILSGFVVPFGVKPYSDMFNVMDGSSSTFIAELQPLTIFDNMYLSSILICTFALIAFGKQKIRISDGLFIIGFAILAMNNIRSVYYFILISSLCFVRLFNKFIDNYDFEIIVKSSKMKNLFEVLGSIIILMFFCKVFLINISYDYIEYEKYPVKACYYIKNNLDIDNIKIYNGFNYGSYLEFQGIKAFIDSRSGIFTPEFNPGCNILEDWYSVSNMILNYNEVFDEYEITHVLLYSYEPISQYIKYDSKWKMIYQDSSFILYERVEEI